MECYSKIIHSAKNRGFSRELTKVAVMMELAGHDGELYGIQFIAENLHGQHESEEDKLDLFLSDIEVYESEYIMDHADKDSRLNDKYGEEAEQKLSEHWNGAEEISVSQKETETQNITHAD